LPPSFEYTPARRRVAVVEATVRVAARDVAETVDLDVLALPAEVADELAVVADLRRTPDLRRVRHVRVARGSGGGGIVTLHAARRRVGLAPFGGQRCVAVRAERQSDLAVDLLRETVAFVVLAAEDLDLAAFGQTLEAEVDDACDRVGAVLCSCAVTQHFDLVERERREHGDVDALRTVGQTVAEEGDDRGTVATLAVDEDQGVVRRQSAQVGRAYQGGGVVDRDGADVERGHQHLECVEHVGGALVVDFFGVDDVDRHRRIGRRARGAAGTEHRDRLERFRVVVRRRRLLRKRRAAEDQSEAS
jgi:hypothetical protein